MAEKKNTARKDVKKKKVDRKKKPVPKKETKPVRKPAKKSAAKKEAKVEKKPVKEEKKPAVVEEEVVEEPLEEAEKKPVKREKPKKEKKEKPIEKIKFFGRKKLSAGEKRIYRKRSVEKKSKPRFMRQELMKLKRLKDVWRKPRGEDSKQAEGKRGKPKRPKIGYKKSKDVRGLHPSGFYPVTVHNLKELSEINPEEQAVVIASSVGRKKRNKIIKEANKGRITILNPRKGEI